RMSNAFRPSTAAALAVVTMTAIIPYNLFMNAHQYFYYKLRHTADLNITKADGDLLEAISAAEGNHDSGPTTELQRTYEGWFTVTSGITCILGALVNTVATHRLSNSFRVMVGHGIVLVSLMPTLFYTFIDTDHDQVSFFWFTMLFSSISSFASQGLIGAGIQGLAAAYSSSYVRVVMIANAAAGMGTSLLSIGCQAATDNAILNGRIYFGLAFIWTIVSVFCYLYLISAPQEKECVEMNIHKTSTGIFGQRVHPSSLHIQTAESQATHSSLLGGWVKIVKQGWPDMACMMFVIMVSCSAFPALASQVRPHTGNATWKAYFISICCFLLYGFADGLGRIFAMRISISRRTLQNLSLARLLLLPLIAVCDVQPRRNSPTLIYNDAVFVSLIMTLGLSFGFCFTHAYVKAIQSVDSSLREKAGSMLSLACNSIALVGSMIGVAIVTLM
ncbi:ent-6, partial [Pristionchus pacificus]